jgi:DNA-binding NtrC family response regulator
LQEREFERLGGNTPIRVDARFVAATNYNLPQEVKKQSFREDLYFRLNVVALQLPPLRERQTDISLLANYFIAKYNTQLNKSVRGFSEEAMALLQAYAFPGNVRELENFVERALLLTKGELIMPDVLKEIDTAPASAVATDIPIVSKQFDVSRSHVIESFERQFVIRQLEEYTGNVTLAAKSSGMTRQNFQRLMKKYSIEASSFRK